MSITLPPLPELNWTANAKDSGGPVKWVITTEQLRARDIEVARVVLEGAAKALDRLDKQARRYFAEKGTAGMPEYDAVDCARYIRALEATK